MAVLCVPLCVCVFLRVRLGRELTGSLRERGV